MVNNSSQSTEDTYAIICTVYKRYRKGIKGNKHGNKQEFIICMAILFICGYFTIFF